MLWEKKGWENTEGTIEAAIRRAKELGVQSVVVASNSGETAGKLIGKDLDIICVTHQVGFVQPGVDEMDPVMRQNLYEKGVKVLTTTHLLAGVDRALRFKFDGVYPAEIIANSLRMLGQGLKVCVEISAMALDAGLIPFGREVIAIGGTGRGADTAVVIVPAHSHHIFDTRVHEIICWPREK